MKQPGFFDVEERLARLSGLGDQLEAFSRTVDFEVFRSDLDKALAYSDGRKGGLPPFDPVLMGFSGRYGSVRDWIVSRRSAAGASQLIPVKPVPLGGSVAEFGHWACRILLVFFLALLWQKVLGGIGEKFLTVGTSPWVRLRKEV